MPLRDKAFTKYMSDDDIRIHNRVMNRLVLNKSLCTDSTKGFGEPEVELLRQIQREHRFQVTGTVTSEVARLIENSEVQKTLLPSYVISDLEIELDIPEGLIRDQLIKTSNLQGFDNSGEVRRFYTNHRLFLKARQLLAPALFREFARELNTLFGITKKKKDRHLIVPMSAELYDMVERYSLDLAVAVSLWGLGAAPVDYERLKNHAETSAKALKKDPAEQLAKSLREFVERMKESERYQFDLFYLHIRNTEGLLSAYKRNDVLGIEVLSRRV